MKIKCLVVSGFLESGKTTYINQYLTTSNKKTLVLCCEEGIESYHSFKHVTVKTIYQQQLNEYIFDNDLYDEIIIEYNGTWDPQLFLQLNIFNRVNVHWIHMIDGQTFDFYFKNMYELMANQIVNANEVKIIKTTNPKRIINILKILNPALQSDYLFYLMVVIGGLILLLFRNDLAKFITIFSSIVIQSIPFLLLGVFVSSIIQLYVSETSITSILNRFPKIIAYPLSIILTGFLPVCDCAMVPVATRFMQKGVPLSQVIVFLLASTSLNPLVLISTYFAFSNLQVVIHRILITITISVIVAMFFAFKNNKNVLQDNITLFSCSSGYIGNSPWKIELILRHIGLEFIRLLKYVFVGAFISTAMQLFLSYYAFNFASHYSLMLIALILFSSFISICSTSNAFVARSLTTIFPYPFILLFMCIGPMLDIKNLLLLRFGFKDTFIIRYVTIIIVIVALMLAAGLLL